MEILTGAALVAGLAAMLWAFHWRLGDGGGDPFAALERDREMARGRVSSFISALQAGRVEAAIGALDPGYRESVGHERLRQAFEQGSQLLRLQSLSLGMYEGRGTAATLSGTASDGTTSYACTFYFNRRDGGWYITGIDLGGRPLLPRPGAG